MDLLTVLYYYYAVYKHMMLNMKRYVSVLLSDTYAGENIKLNLLVNKSELH